MAEYIEREAAIAAAFSTTSLGNTAFRDVYDTVNRLRLVPAADVHPVRHGRWVNSKVSFGEMCSECKFIVWWDDDGPHKFNFCPNCGAKMDLTNN